MSGNGGFELAGAGVVVTGAGHGIGEALARRFAAAGARVVVNDLDAKAAEAVAEEIGAGALPGDAADPDGVEALITGARAALGEIDLYCANAGTAVGGSEQAADADWERSWQVNVMSHVRASRMLTGPWLERGRGHWISTVSAAGLLTMLDAAPYAVTKHAALAFAEWLAVTYQHRGITVQALCPQGVRTDMLGGTGAAGDLLLRPTAIEPSQVAETVVEALADGRFLILPHPETAQMYQHRATDTDRWLRGLGRVQQQLDATR
ncbi:SDR family NAD(P)-dependent oxidoreductase [Wenjunlia tyrosinilytica]|uniref:Dehydrogenase n=1 Tax=Wenjunlia tyrosinilytica TaxID=1544741 RepID=A0A917ZLB5_9ACTN|nr:SDR family oxidoreductase [Wenjunlia tyrosinilytica]GGO84420.1 dehydrogenase [Wenjunlia tyrosinilytica]